MSDRELPLDELLEFPCSFTFRVVAVDQPGLADHCQQAVERALGRQAGCVTHQPSRSGRYGTVRVEATVHQADEITRAYGALRSVDGLKMLL